MQKLGPAYRHFLSATIPGVYLLATSRHTHHGRNVPLRVAVASAYCVQVLVKPCGRSVRSLILVHVQQLQVALKSQLHSARPSVLWSLYVRSWWLGCTARASQEYLQCTCWHSLSGILEVLGCFRGLQDYMISMCSPCATGSKYSTSGASGSNNRSHSFDGFSELELISTTDVVLEPHFSYNHVSAFLWV